MENRKLVKKILSCIFIFCLIIGIAITLNKITLNRTSQGCIQLTDFYKLDEDTVDVLFIGSSHVYYSVHTCLLYDKYGIASYLLASPGQPVWMSYYFLEEALKTQSPRLVVFDVCTLYQKAADVGASSWPSLISMKPSYTKWKAIRAVNSEGELLDALGAYLSFPYYHTRYKELTRQDYHNTERVRYNGYKPNFNNMDKEELEEWMNIDKTGFNKIGTITERTEMYLRNFIELCQGKNIPLLIVNAPYANHTLEKQQSYNYVSKVVHEYGIPFLDANYDSRITVEYEKDLFEPSHLNYTGSVKYTEYLAEALTGYVKLPDRRGDGDYRHWDEVSDLFRHMELNKMRLQLASTLAEYADALRGMQQCVVAVYQNPYGEAAVYDEGVCVFRGRAGQQYFRHFDLGDSDMAIQGDGNLVQVTIDKKRYPDLKEGVHIIVYDKVAKCVIGSAGFGEQGLRVGK